MPFLKRVVEWGGSTRGYQVYVPEGAESPLPAILFLHGMGESGVDNDCQALIGLGNAIRSQPEKWPFLVVFPQKAEAGVLWPSYSGMLNQIVASVGTEFQIDSTRLFLTGLSQGGNGTFALAGQLRWSFAGVAPICGWGDPREVLDEVGDLPMWIFHGQMDPVVPPSCSQAIYDWMATRGSKSKKLTLFPEADHNSWDDAYLRSELAEWFLSL